MPIPLESGTPFNQPKQLPLRETDIVPENGWLEDDRFLLVAPAYLPGFFCCSNSGRQFSTLNLRVFPGFSSNIPMGESQFHPWFSRRRCQPQLLALLLWLQHHACQGVEKQHDGNLRIFIGISSTFFLGCKKKTTCLRKFWGFSKFESFLEILGILKRVHQSNYQVSFADVSSRLNVFQAGSCFSLKLREWYSPKTKQFALKNHGWKTMFVLKWSLSRGIC